MQPLTPAGQNILTEIARRYNLSNDSAVSMLVAVKNGGGTMAQFSCPELGSGQWMRGGMTMVGDMFNHTLKATVDNLCNELSNALASNQMFAPAAQGGAGAGEGQWWPEDLGAPSSSGSQNNIRYAFFPQAQRLVVERYGQVSVYKTFDHRIRGVSQQQGDTTSLTFTSQYGAVSTASLPLVSGPGLQATDPTNFAPPPVPVTPPVPSEPSISVAELQGTDSANFAPPPTPVTPPVPSEESISDPGLQETDPANFAPTSAPVTPPVPSEASISDPELQETEPTNFILLPTPVMPLVPSEASVSDSELQETDPTNFVLLPTPVTPPVPSEASISAPELQETDPADFPSPPAPVAPLVPSETSPGPSRQTASLGAHDILSLLEKLGQLRDSGVLTDDEFAAKKAELLARL